MELFQQATKLKLRFETTKGLISTEDLWDLPLTSESRPSLNGVAKAISKKLREDDSDDFVGMGSKENVLLTLQLDVVREVITTKLAEKEAATTLAVKQSQKQQIEQLIQQKKNESLAGKSVEELEAMMESL